MTDQEFKTAVMERFDRDESRLDRIEHRLGTVENDTYIIKAVLGIANINPDMLRRAVFPVETA